MAKRNTTHTTSASKAVARKGITVGTSQGARSDQGNRFPETARRSAQSAVRSAMAKRAR